MGKEASTRPLEIILSLAAIAAIFFFVDIGKVAGIISRANPWWAIAGMAAYFCTMLLMSYRIRMVLSALGVKLEFSHAFFANAAGLLSSDFTPARAGYFATPIILSKTHAVPLEKGMMAIISPQIIEFFLKATGAAAAILLILYSIPSLSSSGLLLWAGVGLMLLFSCAMGVALFVPSALAFARRFSFLPFVGKICDLIQSIQQHRKPVARLLMPLAMISCAVFLLKGIEWYFFGIALGVGFSSPLHPFMIFLLLQPLITVFQFAPFPTVAGIGISEGSAVASMALLGVPTELAVAYALLVRAGTVLLDLVGVKDLLSVVLPKKQVAA